MVALISSKLVGNLKLHLKCNTILKVGSYECEDYRQQETVQAG